MKKLLLPYLFIISICFFTACAAGRSGSGSTKARDTTGIGFNTSGINRSVPPPVGRNQPLGSVGMGSNDMRGTVAINELNQDKVMNQNPESGNTTNKGLSNWDSANMSVNQFIDFAHQSGSMEIALGKLAKKKASKEEVKAFADDLISDHTGANKELEKLAKEKNIKISSGKSGLEDLVNLEGPDFEREYINRILDDHKTKIAMYERASSSEDDLIRAFSSKHLPVLKSRLAQAFILKK